MSVPELEKRLRDTRDRLFQMNLRKVTGQVEKTHEFRQLRREIAQLNTFINQKRRPVTAAA